MFSDSCSHVGREALAPDELLARMRLSAEDVRGLVIDQCTGSPADAIVREATARHAVLVWKPGDLSGFGFACQRASAHVRGPLRRQSGSEIPAAVRADDLAGDEAGFF